MAIRRSLLHSCAPVIVLGSTLVATNAAQRPVHKLNPPLAREYPGEVRDTRLSLDGTWVVYRASPGDGFELFSVPVKGGREPIRLAPISAYDWFEITPDGSHVVYEYFDEVLRVPIDGGRSVELAASPYFRLAPDGRSAVCLADWSMFVVSVDGATSPVTIVPPTVGMYIGDFRVSPDGTWVVYRAARDSDELFSVRLDGSTAPVKLSGNLVAGGRLRSFAISPDGTRVVYTADQDTVDAVELFAVPIDGSAPAIKLNRTLPAGRRVHSFEVVSASRVVYTADQDEAAVFELFGVPIDGTRAPVQLNRPLLAGVDLYFFSSTPDGRWIVYDGEQETPGMREFFAVASDGSAGPRKLNDPLPAGTQISGHLSGDGTQLLYQTWSGGLGQELYAVSVLRDVPAVPLSGGVVPGGEFSASPDGKRVVFSGTLDGSEDLFSVPLAGGVEPVALGASMHGNLVQGPQFTPDGARVVFHAEESRPNVGELFSVPTDASAPAVRLSKPFEGKIVADVIDVQLGADGEHAVFHVEVRGGEGDDPSSELYSVALAAREPVELFPAGPLAAGDDVGLVRVAAGAGRVVFQGGAVYQEGAYFDLFSAPLDGHAPPVQLNERLLASEGPDAFELAEASGLVIYAQRDRAGTRQLFAVPLDGSRPPEQLSAGRVRSFAVSPDGTRVAYAGDGATSLEVALFSVPTDASAPPLQLVPALRAPLASLHELAIAADSRTLVYRTDQDADDVFELYAVPLDGSGGARKLSGALVARGDVRGGFQVVGGRAYYRADQAVDERIELHSVALDGSAPPVKLSGTTVPEGDVRDEFRVSPDGSRVVFLADREANERVELFSTPTDGSASPVKLNAALGIGGDVVSASGSFRISPDGRRVVYRADQARDEVFELYSVPIDGRAPPLQISGLLPPGGDVLGEFEFGADGNALVYVADQRLDDVFELFETPLARIKQSRRISADLVADGDVLDGSGIPRVAVARDAGVLYLADQEVDGVLELYLVASGRRERLLLPR